uniref:Uncharacterized protein AlNc14C62G4489 n=1 Tax=Albugo laibachii Nc14 TaxID=890382 RepID=F0WCW1_9STRA|nr:conserved hypothetical protein [Albugo laibachii Nc14]|eukprot:CCA19032.1 conserved hypothetical protein [Albugo laibachii Nc14]
MLHLRQRVIRSLARHERGSLDWNVMYTKLSDPQARAALEGLQNVHAQIQADAREYVKEPEPIDFEHYRSVIKDKDLVDAIEQNYKSIKFPVITPQQLDNTVEGSEIQPLNEKQMLQEMFDELDGQLEDSKTRITELKEFIRLMQETRTTLDTTMPEMTAMYPEIHEEIDEEIANMEWDKDLS